MNAGIKDVPRQGFRIASLVVLNLIAAAAYASAPSQPAQLHAAVYSSDTAEILWSRSTDDVTVTGYELTINGESLGILDQLSYYRNDFTPGDRYDVSVTAIDDEGNRSPTSSVSFVAGSQSDNPIDPPVIGGDEIAAPTGLRASVYSSKSLEVFWDRVSSSELSYKIFVDDTLQGTTTGVSRYISDLQKGREYRIRVIAVGKDGSESDAAVLNVSLPGGEDTGGEDTGNEDTDTEGEFSDTRIAVYSRTAAELFWTRPEGTVVTEIFRNGERLSQTQGTSYFDGKRLSGVEYSYELIARDASGQLIARATIGETDIVKPPEDDPKDATELANVLLVQYSSTAAELFWEKADDSVSTTIKRDGVVIGQTPGSSFYDGARQRGSSYQYELLSTDTNGRLVGQATIADGDVPPIDPPVDPPIDPPVDPPVIADVFSPLQNDISPDRSIYLENGYAPVNVIRVDLRTETTPGTCIADDISGCTLADVLNDTDKNDDLKVDIPVHFMSDDFADDGSVNNAELRLRGGGSRFAAQKSFRIKLDSKEELWRDERYLQLNKHPFESGRMRNKLAMDLMSRVPHLPSFRTQFVNLWIDDGEGPVDYGFYTHVERINDDYLKARGLDKDGNLYKAEDFRFSERDLSDVLVDEDGEPLDEDRFESSLGIEEGKDHRALVAMLTALNDPQQSFESVLEKHFNRNNVLAWMAVNIMLKQDDGTRHNFILYNPSETETFYFLPWDYDATMSRWELPDGDSLANADLKTRLSYGYALGSENVFMEKFYRLPGIHEEMVQAVNYLRQSFLDDATITDLSEFNAQLIEPFQTRLPDSEFNPEYNASPSFAKNIRLNVEAVSTRFSIPIPPTLFEPELEDDGNWKFSWQPAYDPTGNAVSYDLQIATSPSFSPDDIAVDITGIEDSSDTVKQLVDVSQLRDDTYYVRLIARSMREPGTYWTPARNRVVEGDVQYYGMIEFATR